jgi:hypothetical protein
MSNGYFSLSPVSRSFCLVMLLVLLLSACGSKGEKDVSTSAPALSEDTVLVENEPEEGSDDTPRGRSHNIIQYSGATDGEIKRALETFSPFIPVQTLASKSISLKDSLEMRRENQKLTDPDDSLIFSPVENATYQAILDYKKRMAAGTPLKDDDCPGLLELVRFTEAADSSSHFLPEAGSPGFLSHGNFFFLGGAPFIYRLQQEDNSAFTDSQGKPEVRFATSITENANYLLHSVYHFKNGPIDVAYGPPLDSYEMGPQEVRGIGSLIHRFVERIPVFFITAAGPVPAHLVSITLKLVPEGLGCRSDQPLMTFACSKNLEEGEILGVYIPYGASSLTSAVVSRPSDYVWTADLNDDGIADLACVSGTFEGIASDTMAECLWFVNLNGTWKIIDWGEELDCT